MFGEVNYTKDSANTVEEGGIHKTVARRTNNRQTVRQNWKTQMHQPNMAGNLRCYCFILSHAGQIGAQNAYRHSKDTLEIVDLLNSCLQTFECVCPFHILLSDKAKCVC